MEKKKKGATLIFVIIIIMFLTIVAIGTLSMILGNYKSRVAESRRIENLYASESGLDIAYNICGKTMESAIKYGYYQVLRLRYEDESNGHEFKEKYDQLKDDINQLNENIKNIEKKKDKSDNDNKIIEKCRKGIETDRNVMDEIEKEEFKSAFKAYIKNEYSEAWYKKSDVLKGSIENHKYTDVNLSYKKQAGEIEITPEYEEYTLDYFTDYTVNYDVNSDFTDEKPESANNEYPKVSVKKLDLQKEGNSPKEEISNYKNNDERHFKEVEFKKQKKEYFDIVLDSQFLAKEKVSKHTGENKREIQAGYKMPVPEYDEVLWQTSLGDMNQYTIFEGNLRGLTIGGNMCVEDCKSLSINGDIFIEGNPDEIENADNEKVYGKYRGGVEINNSKVNFSPALDVEDDEENSKADIVTRGTFNIQNKAEVNEKYSEIVNEESDFLGNIGESAGEINLYAANVYVGNIRKQGLSGSELSEDSKLIVNNMIIDNDLALNSSNTVIGMENFYGINSNTVDNQDEDEEMLKGSENEEQEKAIKKNSSAIIVNGYKDSAGDEESKIKITDKAYIMGVAHIDTLNNYQTGESVAVKGNYTAYAVPISPDEVFKYDKPLQVLDDDNVNNKAKHFGDYWNGSAENKIKVDKKEADSGGVILPDKTYSIGSIVYKDSNGQLWVKYPNINDSVEKTINEKKSDYAKRVFDLGLRKHESGYDFLERYVECSNDESKMDKVEDMLTGVNEEALGTDYDYDEQLDKLNHGELGAVFNPDKDSTIEITGTDAKGVIVTKGHVKIKDNADFTGVIIAGGDLTIEDINNEVTVTYDKKVVNDVIKNNQELFHNVFSDFTSSTDYNEHYGEEILLKQILEQKYDVNNFLQKKLWKIVL
ncbi:MAG: pilus assembly PilX N-terminal domain-containing protein [Clostridium sp.]